MRHIFVLFLVTTALLLMGCAAAPAPGPEMVYKPIDLGPNRIKLIEEYRCTHYQLCDKDVAITPRMIVLHWTATTTWQQAYNLFKSPVLTSRADLEKYGLLNTSAQFLVARNGTVYQLMPSNWMARQVIGLNYLAIGIENVGGVGDRPNLTPAQIYSNVYLVRMLKKQYPSIEYLIGHYEYTCFQNTPLWKEYAQTFVTIKKDPGSAFLSAVRQQVTDLGLKGCPPAAVQLQPPMPSASVQHT